MGATQQRAVCSLATAEELGIEDVLDLLVNTFDIDGDVHRGSFRMRCPNPDHPDNNPSASVRLSDGIFNCFSCDAKGDLIDLGHLVLGTPKRGVMEMLKPASTDAKRAALHKRLEARRKALETPVATRHRSTISVPPEGSYDDGPLDYLKARGFNNRTLRKFGIRFAPLVTLYRTENDGERRSFELHNAIAIPILSETGKCLAWCYRATEQSQGWFRKTRYIYTPEVQDTLNQTWFGLHLVSDLQEITICEGALDAIWCWQNGIPALAILGSQVKQSTKVNKLRIFQKVTLLTDKDLSGVTTAHNLGEALQAVGTPVSVCRYHRFALSRSGDRAKDPQDLCPIDLELVVARSVPFAIWKRGR